MIAFWTICGILILIALLFVLTPLLKGGRSRNVGRSKLNVSIYQQQLKELESDRENGLVTETQFEEGKQEIQKRLLDETSGEDTSYAANSAAKKTALFLGAAIPVISILLYLALGNPQFLGPQQIPQQQADNGQMTTAKVEAMVANLAERLKKNPTDAEGWTMLGRSYMVMKRYSDAAGAFDHASKLLPNDAQVLAEYAESEMMLDPKQLNPKAVSLNEKALKIDPTNPKALTLGGAIAFEQHHFKRVVALWSTLLEQLPPDSDDAKAVMSGIEGARSAAKAEGINIPEPKFAKQLAASGASVSGSVTLAPELESKISPDDTLYIFAQAVSGPKMPLAILKITAKELPLRFSLDDTLAVAPMMKLSDFKEVIVGARISKSGNAMPQSGDLEGFSQPVAVGAKNIRISIDKTVH